MASPFIKAKQYFLALQVHVNHGLPGNYLHDVIHSTRLAQLLYRSPIWWVFTDCG